MVQASDTTNRFFCDFMGPLFRNRCRASVAMCDRIRLASALSGDCHHSDSSIIRGIEMAYDYTGNGMPYQVWQEFARHPVSDFEIPVYEENFTRQELVKLLGECNRGFYFRLSYIVRKVFEKKTLAQFYREARAALKVLLERS